MSAIAQLRKLVAAMRDRAAAGQPIPPSMYGRAATLLNTIRQSHSRMRGATMEALPHHGEYAAGDGAAAAHYEQTKAASIDLIRKQRGSYVMVLQGEKGNRITGSFNSRVAKAPEEQVNETLLDVIAIEFLTDAIDSLIDARRHYAANLARAIRDGADGD